MYVSNLSVGPAVHSQGGQIGIGFYGNGEIALFVESERGREAVATVNLEGNEPSPPTLSDDYVWLKGWSENEGLPEALEKAGLVKLLDDKWPAGFTHAVLAEILEPLSKEIKTAMMRKAA